MRAMAIERKLADLTLASGDFDLVISEIDYVFLSECIYHAKKTSIKKFIPLIGVGATSMQALLVLFIVLIAKNTPAPIPHVSPSTKSTVPTSNPISSPTSAIPGTSAIPSNIPTSAAPATSAVPVSVPTSATPGTYVIPGSDTAIPPAWDSLPTWRKFYSFEFNNYRYFGPEDLSGEVGYIDESLIKEEIDKLKLETIYQSHFGEEHHEINITINAINGISQDYAFAVRFENESGSFLYRNTSLFEEHPLKRYLDKSGLKKYATFRKIVYKTDEKNEVEYISNKYTLENFDNNLIWNVFDKNSYTPNVYHDSQHFAFYDLTIYLDLKQLGNYNSQIAIFKNGMMHFSFAIKNTFMLDENDVKDLLDYLVINASVETTITPIGEYYENQNSSTYLTSSPNLMHD